MHANFSDVSWFSYGIVLYWMSIDLSIFHPILFLLQIEEEEIFIHIIRMDCVSEHCGANGAEQSNKTGETFDYLH